MKKFEECGCHGWLTEKFISLLEATGKRQQSKVISKLLVWWLSDVWYESAFTK